MKKKILMLSGESRYDALGIYIKQLGKCFENMEYDVDYLDGRDDDFESHVYSLTIKNDYYAIIACNAILTGYDKLVQKNSIFCCLMFDHPVHHYERLSIADCRVLLLHCDMKSAEYIAKYCSNIGAVGFVPLAGQYVENIKHYKEREYDIVFTGSNMESEKIYETVVYQKSEKYIRLFNEITEVLKNDVRLTIQEALDIILKRHNQIISNKEFYDTLSELRLVDFYMRAWIREQVVRAIVDAGYKIHIFGNGWDTFECKHPENIIQMQGFGDDSLKVLADAKIALNVMPWFRGGFQERIASAMLCGAISLTDTSTYIEDNFTDGEDILIYDALNPQSITDRIKMILENPELGEKIAKAGYEKAHAGHRWEHRAKEIIDNIQEMYDMRKSKVSVIVPVHNAEKTLMQSLGSLAKQTIDSVEIICVDDASTDGSALILEEFQKAFPHRIKIISLNENKGPGGARNEGLKYATGEYIGFADADDIVDERMYGMMYEHAFKGGYDIVDVGYYREDNDECILYTSDECTGKLDDAKRSELIFGSGGYIWSRLFKAELFGESFEERGATFRENCILEDMDFMFNMFMKAESIGTIKEVLYIYKHYEDSISRKTESTFYRENATNALVACYDKLTKYDNFENVRIAYEAIVYKLYSCMLNQTIVEQCDKKIVKGNETIKELVALKKKLTKTHFKENPYVPRELAEEDIRIMEAIDKMY